MTKEEILSEIRRVAAADGKTPGSGRMATEIGLRKADWYPKLWVRWGDATREAGLTPNSLMVARPDSELLADLIALIRALGRFPIESDLRLQKTRDLTRLGRKRERVQRVLEFCRGRAGYEDVVAICEPIAASAPAPREAQPGGAERQVGYVYLIQHGSRREYKIGRTNSPVRREGEFRLELPEQLKPIHYIKTDDPVGVEAYWHKRFKELRKGGEFFALTLSDVQAFRRWKKLF